MPVKDRQYAEIMRIYDERLREDRLDTERRQAKVAAALPRIGEIDDEIRELSVERAGRLLAGDADAAAGLAGRTEDLLAERRALLLSAGFAEDETEMRYRCPHCRDTGYVDGAPCDCLKRELAKAYVENSHLRGIFDEENFGTFTDRWYTDEPLENGRTVKEHMTAVRDHCAAYARNFSSASPNLLFLGKAGTGKTFFARCISAELLARGIEVVYMTATGLAELLKAGLFYDRPASVDEEIAAVKDCELLVIDDLGTECPTRRSASQLFSCLEDRALRGVPTLITTNLAPEQIREIYSERVFSRMFGEWNIVYMYGDDIRRKK